MLTKLENCVIDCFEREVRVGFTSEYKPHTSKENVILLWYFGLYDF